MKLARIVTLIAVLSLLGACSGSGESDTTTAAESSTTTSDGGGEAGPASITISNFDYSGDSSVALGTTVEVTNEDDVSHTWTSEEELFDSGSLGQGDTFEHTFDEAGEYTFFCKFHPGMEGSITVEG